MINLCVLDFETTGLVPTSDEIIECALKIYEKDIIYNTLVKPDKIGNSKPGCHGAYILPKITELTGITNQMIYTNGISQKQLAENIYKFLETNNIKYIVAHNGESFDFIFLKLLFIKYNFDYTKYKYIDTINLFKSLNNLQSIKVNSYSQQNLCNRYNIIQNNAHRAIGDVLDLENLLYNCLIEYSINNKQYINYNDEFIYKISNVNNYSDIIINHIHKIIYYLQSNNNELYIDNVNKRSRLLIYNWIEKNSSSKIYHKTVNDNLTLFKHLKF